MITKPPEEMLRTVAERCAEGTGILLDTGALLVYKIQSDLIWEVCDMCHDGSEGTIRETVATDTLGHPRLVESQAFYYSGPYFHELVDALRQRIRNERLAKPVPA